MQCTRIKTSPSGSRIWSSSLSVMAMIISNRVLKISALNESYLMRLKCKSKPVKEILLCTRMINPVEVGLYAVKLTRLHLSKQKNMQRREDVIYALQNN